MLYGERLKFAMERRSGMLGQDVTRKDVAKVAGTSVQNIGMIINNAKGRDQKLNTRSHAAVAAYLRVSSGWLLTGEGPIDPPQAVMAPKQLTPAAVELALLFDLIPEADRIRRAKALNGATTAILQLLQSEPPPAPPSCERK